METREYNHGNRQGGDSKGWRHRRHIVGVVTSEFWRQQSKASYTTDLPHLHILYR